MLMGKERDGNLRTSLGTLGVIVVAGLLSTGCPNPNTYGTPRTTPKGKVAHTVAAEGFGFSYDDPESDTAVSGTLPTFPTYQLRYGISDEFDFGARIANFTSLGGDVKWNFVRSEIIDVAIDPGFQWYNITIGSSSTNVVYLHGPLMVGLNVAEPFSIVLTPGVTYGFASSSLESEDDRDAAATADGVMGRVGVGFDFRLSEGFAIHPEITFMKSFRDDGLLLYTFGLGFNFGKLPSFADVGGEPAPLPK
jgi:hypothetical protein